MHDNYIVSVYTLEVTADGCIIMLLSTCDYLLMSTILVQVHSNFAVKFDNAMVICDIAIVDMCSCMIMLWLLYNYIVDV